MTTILDINDIAQVGLIRDVPPHQIIPEAWTTALNVIPKDDGMVVGKGWEQVFGTPTVAPHYALPLTTITQTYWIYTSLTKGYIYDGVSHTNITRTVGGDYTAGETRDWNGTLFAGIPIINNNNDEPQFWAGPPVSNKLQGLTSWPVGAKTKRIISFGAYLVALNYTVGGINYPHLVKWSSEATDPGTLPQSWDETDATVDTGEYDLPDVNSGVLQDALTLGSKLFLYKDQSMWTMRFTGGRAVFTFDTFSETMGILAPRCVALTGDGKKHVVATQDDIVIHDGTASPVSIINKRMRRAIFNDLDPTNYINSFMFSDPENDLIVFCYPQTGSLQPNMSLNFNYRTGAITEYDGITFRNAASGRVESSDTETWASATGTWDTDTVPWSLSERRKIVLCNPDDTKMMKWASTYQRDGVDYAVTLQRTGLSLVGRKRSGEWIVDRQIYKLVDRIMAKIQGEGTVFCRLGSQDAINGSITWSSYFQIGMSAEQFVDIIISTRAVAIEFYSPVASDWRLDGYKISLTPGGRF